MFCTSCGTKNGADANFCKECGQRLDKGTARVTEEAFDRALPDEEQVSALLERAYRLRREGDVAGAIALCEEALQLRQTSTSAHSLLGQLYESQGERDKAIQQYEYVLQLNPGSIADRVKLDALKDGTLPSDRRPHGVATSAPIVLNGRGEADTVVGRTLAVVGGVAALLLLGGIFALQLRGHTDTARPVSTSFPLSVTPYSIVPNPAPGGQATPLPSKTPFSGPATPAANPSTGNVPPPTVRVVSAPPQQIVYQVAQPPRVRYESAPAPRNGTKTARQSSAPARPDTPDAGDNRKVRLTGDDGVTIPEGGQVTIHVTPEKSDKPKAPNAGGEGDKPVKDRGIYEVHVTRPTTHGGSNPSSLESRSFLTMGNDRKKRGDWVGAIKAFRNALGQSGDDAGYLYQQIGLCFQKSGDKNSALTNYERAISEYQKQSNTDAAQDGIRVCQSGIRACN